MKWISYVYYVMRPIDMNNELNPILLDSDFDSWICESLMYQPAVGGYQFNFIEGYGWQREVATANKIKDSGKAGSERIYQALKEIERVKGIKL